MRFEGGFQGRCNKLVDGCYSFWQAGLLPLLHRALHAQGESTLLLGLEEEPPGLLLTQCCRVEVEENSACQGFEDWYGASRPWGCLSRVPFSSHGFRSLTAALACRGRVTFP